MGFDLISRLLFPAPKSSYGVDSFPGELLWVPKTLRPHSCGPQDCIPCLFLPYSSARFMIFYLHSNAEDLGRCHSFCASLRTQFQVHVFAVEYPGYGLCPGGYSDERTVTENAFVAFRFIYEVLKWPLDSIIIMGRSIGCGPAISVTVRYQVSGLILVSPMLSVRDLCWDVAGPLSYVMEERFPNKERVPLIRSPLLVVHGQKDVIVPCRHGVELYRGCRSRKLLVCPQEMEHNTNLLADVAYLVLPMLQFFALPDYCFEEVQVPKWAYDKRLSTHFAESLMVGETADDGDFPDCAGESDGLGRRTPLQPLGCFNCSGGCAGAGPKADAILSEQDGKHRRSQGIATTSSTPMSPLVVAPAGKRPAGAGGACAATFGISATLANIGSMLPARAAMITQPGDDAAGPVGPLRGPSFAGKSLSTPASMPSTTGLSLSGPTNDGCPAAGRPSASLSRPQIASPSLAGAAPNAAHVSGSSAVPQPCRIVPPLQGPSQHAGQFGDNRPGPYEERTASRNRFGDVGRDAKGCSSGTVSTDVDRTGGQVDKASGASGSACSRGSGREAAVVTGLAAFGEPSRNLRHIVPAFACAELPNEDMERCFMAPPPVALPTSAAAKMSIEGPSRHRPCFEELGTKRPTLAPVPRPAELPDTTPAIYPDLVMPRLDDGLSLEPPLAGVIIPNVPQSAPPAPQRECPSDLAAEAVALAIAATTTEVPLRPSMMGPLPTLASRKITRAEGPQASLRRLQHMVHQPRQQMAPASSPIARVSSFPLPRQPDAVDLPM